MVLRTTNYRKSAGARVLYDGARTSDAIKLPDKRGGIDILVMLERMTALSEQEIADCVTKPWPASL